MEFLTLSSKILLGYMPLLFISELIGALLINAKLHINNDTDAWSVNNWPMFSAIDRLFGWFPMVATVAMMVLSFIGAIIHKENTGISGIPDGMQVFAIIVIVGSFFFCGVMNYLQRQNKRIKDIQQANLEEATYKQKYEDLYANCDCGANSEETPERLPRPVRPSTVNAGPR